MTENYMRKPLIYKIKKVLRFFRLYGFLRTVTKIRGQYHFAPKEQLPPPGIWFNSQCRIPDAQKRRVAIIGCGNFAFSTIAYYCSKHNKNFLRSTFDLEKWRAISLCRAYNGLKVVDSMNDIANDPDIDLVFIASNHASHADYAQLLIAAGKNVHIEKPHVVNHPQLRILFDAMELNPNSKVYLGFNRPKSSLFKFIDEHLSKQQGSLMINWFIAGHDIPDDHWYFSKEEGGRILGNLCHWTDFTLKMIGLSKAFPVEVIPGSSPETKSDFVINYRFADKSIGVITFSAKKEVFEGVREWLSAHKGSAIVRMMDFQKAQVDIDDKILRKRLFFRDHGHQNNILNSLTSGPTVSKEEMAASAMLFLATREAVESGRTVTVNGKF